MALPRGITGVWGVSETPPPATDVRTFRRYCYEAARRLSGRVVSMEEPSGRSFAVATLANAAERVAVLLNAYHPLVGFATPPREGGVLLRFRDCPAVAESLRQLGGYEVLPASDLERPLTPDDFAGLSEAELAQVRYWHPQRLGDVVFNCWD